MRLKKQILSLVVLACIFALIPVGPVAAQEKPKDYPTKPIEIYVVGGPGGGSDIFTRTICLRARRYLKNPLVVINKPGGGGAVAAEYLQSKPADGYTLLSGAMLALVESPLLGMVKYTYEDWQPVIRAQLDTMMLVGLPDGKYKNVQEAIADAKARPGKQTWGVVGTATGFNAIVASQFTEAINIKVKLVPFDRAGKQHAALLGKHLDLILEEPGPISQLIQSNKMKPLMVFAEKRINEFADVPTTKEVGAEAYMGLFRGIAMKKGTPRPIVDYLHANFKKAMDFKMYQDFEKSNWLHLRPGYQGPDDFDAFLRKQVQIYTKEFKRMGVYKGPK
jgi:tripartite-type tricarboxylate transporter receptor subunit TctC